MRNTFSEKVESSQVSVPSSGQQVISLKPRNFHFYDQHRMQQTVA